MSQKVPGSSQTRWSFTRGRGRASMAAIVSFASLAAYASLGARDARADDKSGVSPSRLHLPKGPGSIEGVGENAEPSLTMGLMEYGVPIELPGSYEGATPSLRIAYSSASGNGELGIGWSLAIPTIERMTSFGVPAYGGDDRFAANGGEELARVGAAASGGTTYRARFEGGFVRYTWTDPDGTGQNGSWKAEYPDGRIGYFGAYADGTVATGARVRGPLGVFRWALTEMRDALGHRVVYEYRADGVLAIPSRIAYGFERDTPRYQVLFDYAARPDALSDARPGFETKCSSRLTGVRVLVNGQQLRRYALGYEAVTVSGGLSRLASVLRYGTSDVGPYPVQLGFAYSGALGAAGNAPAIVDMGGDTGIDLRAGNADLVDINGDAVPDLVDTSGGANRFFVTSLAADGSASFGPAVTSATSNARLLSPHVHMLDVNGDGFTDLVDSSTYQVWNNRGRGDWAPSAALPTQSMPDLANDPNLRFYDFDDDKRIDALHADRSGTWVYRNDGSGSFQLVQDGIDPIGASFKDDALQLADMNGDGMLDVVHAVSGIVTFRTSFGRGHFAPWAQMSGVPTVNGDVSLVDVNADGLADLVTVQGNSVAYALNRDSASFGPLLTLTASAALPIPIRTSDVSVRFADMNGNGSTDVVWFTPTGHATFLDLFPRRPNLLTRISNAIGMIIEAQYESAAVQMARDGGASAWTYRLPHAMTVLAQLATYDTVSGARRTQLLHYRDGYYDGAEKQFRGFANVEETTPGGRGVEDGLVRSRFEVGQSDPYRKELLLEQTSFSGGREIADVTMAYVDCAVDEAVGGAPSPVRYVCPSSTRRIVKEGLAASAWVTLDESYGYDGYGNRAHTANMGVTAASGDEHYEDITFVTPAGAGGRWMLRKPASRRVYGTPGSAGYSEELFHYDGAAFVGLAVGQLTNGLVSRIESRVDASQTIDSQRTRYDANGAVVESMDPNGHRRLFGYDSASLLLLSETQTFDDPGHAPYALQMTATYEPILETVVSSSHWARSTGGAAPVDARMTAYAYDNFGRLTALAKPGDTLAAPTEQYLYGLGDPTSRIIKRMRTTAGGAADLEEVRCLDGMGRTLQTRTLVQANKYQISGFAALNPQGKPWRTYQAYLGTSRSCDLTGPQGVRYEEVSYDAMGRALSTVHPDADQYGGTASATRTTYAPLRAFAYDEEDTNAGGAYAGTPVVTYTDGLGRTVGFDRYVDSATALHTTITYDELGHVRGYVDANGNVKDQAYDRLGRLLTVRDPDSGLAAFTYDAAGNRTSATDARGVKTLFRYDEANRLREEWDASNEPSTHIDYAYDASDSCASCTNLEGQLAQTTYPTSSGTSGSTAGGDRAEDRMGYDVRGRAMYLARSIDGNLFELGTDYDDADRVTASHYPDGSIVRYTLDGLGRRTSVPGYVPQVSYDGRGLAAELTFGNGVKTDYAYDARQRLASITTVTPASVMVQSATYTRDRVGNIVHVSDGATPADQPSANADYAYDALYRLTSSRLDAARPAFDETVTLAYDAIDNIVSKTSSWGDKSPDHVGAYTYAENGAGPHAVTTAGSMRFAYDAAGNMTSHGPDAYVWDFMGRMTQVGRGDAKLGSSTFGGSKTRVKKSESGHTTYYVSPDYEVRDGLPTQYVTTLGAKVAKVEHAEEPAPTVPDLAPLSVDATSHVTAQPDGRVTAGDAWAAQAESTGIFAGAATTATLPARDSVVDDILAASAERRAAGDAKKVTYLHHDASGTIAATTGAVAEVVQRAVAYPSGVPRGEAAPLAEEYRYTGAEDDRGSGLTYFGARFLDARLGRWVSADAKYAEMGEASLHASIEANRYAFVEGNPVNLVDVDGNDPKSPGAALWLKCGAVILYDHVLAGAWAHISIQQQRPFVASDALMKSHWGDASPLRVSRDWVLTDANYRFGYEAARSKALVQTIKDVTARAAAGEIAGSASASGKEHPYATPRTDEFYAAGGADLRAEFHYAFTVSGSHATVTLGTIHGAFDDLYRFNEVDDKWHWQCQENSFGHTFRTQGEWQDPGFTFDIDLKSGKSAKWAADRVDMANPAGGKP